MNLSEILACIQAFETLLPSVISFVNVVHPQTDAAPTRATTALQITGAAVASLGVAAETYQALNGAVTAAVAANPPVSPSATPVVVPVAPSAT
jgi:hypothetical protein